MQVFLIQAHPQNVPIYASTPQQALNRYRVMNPKDKREFQFDGSRSMWVRVDDTRQRIGIALARLRQAKGMSQEDLATATGYAQSNIARIENGKYSVGIDVLAKIADVLGAQIELKAVQM